MKELGSDKSTIYHVDVLTNGKFMGLTDASEILSGPGESHAAIEAAFTNAMEQKASLLFVAEVSLTSILFRRILNILMSASVCKPFSLKIYLLPSCNSSVQSGSFTWVFLSIFKTTSG